jgi:hypothetical protein
MQSRELACRVGLPICLKTSSKLDFTLSNQGFGLTVAASFRLFDTQKLRFCPESIKAISAKLSTGADLAGGQLCKCLTVV